MMKEQLCTTVGMVGGFIAALLGGWDTGLQTLMILILSLIHIQMCIRDSIQAAQKSINADVTKNQQTQQAFNSNLQEAKDCLLYTSRCVEETGKCEQNNKSVRSAVGV